MIEVLYLGSVFCAFLSVYILLFKQDALRGYADYLLAIFFIFEAWGVIIYLLIYSGWIVNVPHFYKTAAPFNFLFPPLTYLYVRAVLYNETRFAKKDLIHFIPFFFFIINYFPFFILPIEQKREIVIATTKNLNLTYSYQAGLIPEYIAYFFRTAQTLLYLIFQWRLIIRFKKENTNNLIENQIREVIKWLKIFSWASTLFVIAFILLTILAVVFNTIFIAGIINYLPGILISVSFFIISTYIITHPSILEGLPFLKYREGELNILNKELIKIPFMEVDYAIQIDAINKYFETEKPFLKPNFTISHLSVALNLPIREVSYIINNYYNMRFTDFINLYRVNHIIEGISLTGLNNYTIESFAKKSGFSSKTSFYRAFNKIHLCTPLAYFSKLNQQIP